MAKQIIFKTAPKKKAEPMPARTVEKAYNNEMLKPILKKDSFKLEVNTYLVTMEAFPAVPINSTFYHTTKGFTTARAYLNKPLPFFLFGGNDSLSYPIGRKILNYGNSFFRNDYNTNPSQIYHGWHLFATFIAGEETNHVHPPYVTWMAMAFSEVHYIHTGQFMNGAIKTGNLVFAYVSSSNDLDAPVEEYMCFVVISCDNRPYSNMLRGTPFKTRYVDFYSTSAEQINVPFNLINFNSFGVFKVRQLLPSIYKTPLVAQDFYRLPIVENFNQFLTIGSSILPGTTDFYLEFQINY